MHFKPVGSPGDDAYFSHAGGVSEVSDAERPPAHDPLDDVFGSESDSVAELHVTSHTHSHPSDMRRLQTEHSTAGYREALTMAKEKSMQAGFDEGFSIGATVGLVAGQLLGMLEGIAEATKPRADDVSAQTQTLLKEARSELSTDHIFSAQFWTEDGNWTYEVSPGKGEDVLFPDVAMAHPLIQKWTITVNDQISQWKMNRSILDDEGSVRLESVVDESVVSSAPRTTASKQLDW